MKKINKGLILTIIVLIILTIYCITIEKQREQDKKQIDKICENYMEFLDKNLVLPQERQVINEEISENDEHLKQLRTELESFMITNKNAVDIQYKMLENYLKKGYMYNICRTKISNKITKVEKYEFDGNQVKVTLNLNTSEEIKYIYESTEQYSNNPIISLRDEIILQKIDNNWKIVHTNFKFITGSLGGY